MKSKKKNDVLQCTRCKEWVNFRVYGLCEVCLKSNVVRETLKSAFKLNYVKD